MPIHGIAPCACRPLSLIDVGARQHLARVTNEQVGRPARYDVHRQHRIRLGIGKNTFADHHRGAAIDIGVEELLEPRMAGRFEDLGRLALQHDAAMVEEEDAVRDSCGKADLVRHHDHRHAVRGELAHHGEHFAGELWVERGGRSDACLRA